MRLRNDPNANEKLKDLGYLFENYPFKLSKNIIVELGMGKGEMITQLAFENPDRTYIGVEKFATVALRAAKKAKELKLKNFYIICDDISNIKDFFKGKIHLMWLTFSDPWPKKRHAKRRITHEHFLNLYKEFMTKESVIKFKTDNDFLFDYSIESFESNGFILKNLTNDFHSHKASTGNIETGYEKKWREKGKKINYLEAMLKK